MQQPPKENLEAILNKLTPALNDLKVMCGVQHETTELLHGVFNACVFRSKHLGHAEPDRPREQEDGFHIEDQAFEVTNISGSLSESALTLKEWRIKAAQLLLKKAPEYFLEQHHENYTKYNFERARNAIAKMSRRGPANVLVGSKTALSYLLPLLPEGLVQQFMNNIIVFEPGEVMKEDSFLLLGYNGRQQTDTGLVFGYIGDIGEVSGVKGVLIENRTEQYWLRIM